MNSQLSSHWQNETQQTGVREGLALKLKKGDEDGDNPLRFNVVNSRFMEDTDILQKKTKRLCMAV